MVVVVLVHKHYHYQLGGGPIVTKDYTGQFELGCSLTVEVDSANQQSELQFSG